MTNAISKTTTHDVDGYTTNDFRTEDQWLGEAAEHRGKKRELIRLAYVNKFDFAKSQTKLAKMLGCSQSTVSEHVDNLLATGELTEEHYQKKMCNSRKPKQTDRKPIEPVENSTPKTSSLSQQSRESSNTLESKQVLQQEHGHEPVSTTLRILQSNVDTDGEEREVTVSIMATPEQQQIDADWRDACEHLAALEQFSRKYFDPEQGLSERRYEELWQRCNSLAYFAHMRFANQRKADEQCARQITELVVRNECPELLEEGT